jgi:hypothetical protein
MTQRNRRQHTVHVDPRTTGVSDNWKGSSWPRAEASLPAFVGTRPERQETYKMTIVESPGSGGRVTVHSVD